MNTTVAGFLSWLIIWKPFFLWWCNQLWVIQQKKGQFWNKIIMEPNWCNHINQYFDTWDYEDSLWQLWIRNPKGHQKQNSNFFSHVVKSITIRNIWSSSHIISCTPSPNMGFIMGNCSMKRIMSVPQNIVMALNNVMGSLAWSFSKIIHRLTNLYKVYKKIQLCKNSHATLRNSYSCLKQRTLIVN